MCFRRGINEKILKRPEHERAKPAAITICMLQPVVLQYSHQEILREVLRVLSRIAASANKRENGPPISPAKLSERAARLLLFSSRVGGRKNYAPAGGYKLARLAPILLAGFPFHGETFLNLKSGATGASRGSAIVVGQSEESPRKP